MSDRVMEAKDLFERGTPYSEMCSALNVGARHLRRLLSAANIQRRAGRPRAHPDGRRISYAKTGMF